MLKYLVVILDDCSVPYCHYKINRAKARLMPLDVLKKAILFGMKENLNIQFVYPSNEILEEYKTLIDSVEHSNIMPIGQSTNADIFIVENWSDLDKVDTDNNKSYLIYTKKSLLFENYKKIEEPLSKAKRVNIVISDIDSFTEQDLCTYGKILDELSKSVEQMYLSGGSPQTNILTDRMILTSMNNCNAGYESITVAPDGNFYICPAFYYNEQSFSVGNLDDGLDIKNSKLYRIDHAPICTRCDAYQCKRCVWLNYKKTLEVNTPGHIQCVVAHLERNASRSLLNNIRSLGTFLSENKEIKEIDYLDPFEQIIKNN